MGINEVEPSETSAMASTEENKTSPEVPVEEALSTAQRARIERNRQRARALRDARLVQRPAMDGVTTRSLAPDSGGGFLLEEDTEEEPPRTRSRQAPVVDPSERPCCLECSRSFAQSYLFDSFEYRVCDECRDDTEAHALLTRTEAKNLYLLKDCDLDLREPALRCVRRRNPHGSRLGDMRLYLRPQVEARALEVWGSEAELELERERREEARARTKHKQTQKRLRTLRMDVRSSLFDRTRATHVHDFGPERYDEAADQYSRVCTSCGHVESYEKM